MKILLDTHTFLWFVADNPYLSEKAKNIIESEINVLISTASLWEIAIKISLGKLTLTQPFNEFISDQLIKNDIELLPITIEHLIIISTLPFHHRDPFDRMLIAQAIRENLPIISKDNQLDSYGVRRFW